MILTEVVKMKISNNQIKYYKSKGYDVSGGNEIKEIKVSDLPNNSGQKIKVKCDICDKIKEITLNRYNINTKNSTIYYSCSRKCSENKNKETIINKYGVDNISKSVVIKNQKSKTCKRNNGVEHPQQSIEIFNKSLNTKLNKYGNKYYNNTGLMIETKINKVIKKHNAISFIDGMFTFNCNNCGEDYEITNSLYYNRKRVKTEICTKCNPYKSNESPNEKFIYDFIKENYDGNIILKDRDILNGKEIDLYLPDLKIGIEYNGVYWHNELYKHNNYHLEKTKICEEKDIQLIHIWEDDWIYKNEIIKSMLLNKINKTPNKIFARKCEIREIDNNNIIKDFLDQNHIQGYITSKHKIGLYYNDKLVSLMIFGKCRRSTNKSDEWELLRFCSNINTNVIGGFSKLLKYFINKYKEDKKLLTFADRMISNGGVYFKYFKFELYTRPNYYYIINGIKKHRFSYRKNILIKKGYDKNKTEHQIMLDRNIYRVYDSGNMRFVID